MFSRPPRFLSLYRRLFGASGGGGYWAAANNDQLDLRMDKLTGCPDEALLAIAETAQLAQWKTSEAQKGCLSVRELIRRGDVIEQTLRNHPSRSYADSPTTDTAPMLPTGMTAPADMSPSLGGSGADERTRRTIASIWRETAVLYLHTVLSDSQPGKPPAASLSSFGPSETDAPSLSYQAFRISSKAQTCSSTSCNSFRRQTLTARSSFRTSSRGACPRTRSSVNS